MILRTRTVGRLGTNCYVVACERTHQAMVVDPGGDLQDISSTLEEIGAQAQQIVLTHFHFDHILAADPLRQETGASLAIHEAEAPHLTNPPALFRAFSPDVPQGLVADQLLHDGDVLSVGDIRVEVLHTPGHSPGGISLWLPDEQIVFSGDALFREGIGRTDFPGSSSDQLLRSIREKLFALPDETVVYPGHGPSTTVGYEKSHNPWVAVRR